LFSQAKFEEINIFTGMEDSILRVFHRHLAEKDSTLNIFYKRKKNVSLKWNISGLDISIENQNVSSHLTFALTLPK
jgi:hypothetical protein